MIPVQVEDLAEVRIHPYYGGAPLEVDPVVKEGTGRYETGHFAGQVYHTLAMNSAEVTGTLHVGATYSGSGLSAQHNAITTHWMFCTAIEPKPTFGLCRSATGPTRAAPVLPGIDSLLVQLEELTDIVTIFATQPLESSVSQARIGQRGWLVMTRLGCPPLMGILVEEPVLPMALCEGSNDIVISARAVRTMQSVTFDNLVCTSARDSALFLQGAR